MSLMLYACASCILGWSSVPVLARDALSRRGLDASPSRALRFLVAAFCVLGASLAWLLIENPVACVAFSLACACMGALLACDLRHRILPTGFVAAFLGLGIVYRLAMSGVSQLLLIGIPVGCIALTLLALNELRVRRGENELVGSGDLRMLVPLALFSGLQGMWCGICAASVVMGFVALLALLTGSARRGSHIALAPGLCAWLLLGTLIPLA